MFRTTRNWFVSASLLVFASPAVHAICYVDAAAAGANSGASWADAYADLQSALHDGACAETWVKRGVYKPTAGADPAVSFVIPSNFALYGGFAGTETLRTQRDWKANPTILSGDIDSNDQSVGGVAQSAAQIVGTNTYTVVFIDQGQDYPVLDGFTVSAGNGGTRASQATGPNSGGGLYCHSWMAHCNATIRNVVFSGNRAEAYGGGLFVDARDYSHLTIGDVSFIGNAAVIGGGGFANLNAQADLDRVIFSGNSAAKGGAFYALALAQTKINQASFVGNSSPGHGGALYLDTSGTSSGGVFQVANATFQGNTSGDFGTVLYYNQNSPAVFKNVTISGNSGSGTVSLFYGTGGSLFFSNAILWANPANVSVTLGSMSMTQSLMEGGCGAFVVMGSTACTSTYSVDPLLNPLGNYGGAVPTMRLRSGSPAIDTGNDSECATPLVGNVDARGVARPQGAHCDIGAVEYGAGDDVLFANGFEAL